jgi:hypothetical protein
VDLNRASPKSISITHRRHRQARPRATPDQGRPCLVDRRSATVPRCLCFCNVRWLIVIQSGSNRQRYGKNSLLTTSLLPFNVGSRSYTRSEIQRVNRLLVGRHRLLTKTSTTDLCRFLLALHSNRSQPAISLHVSKA